MRLKRITDWVVILLSATILLAMLYAGWCDLIDGRLYKPVIEFGSRFVGPTHLTTKLVYKPGEMVFARIAFQKQRNIPGIIQWTLINHDFRQFTERSGSLPVGVFDHIVPVEKIPIDIDIGEHWFCGTVRYKVNWLSTVSHSIWTNKFEVVKK